MSCLKKVHEHICSKGWKRVKQGLHKLETEEAEVAKTGSIPTVVETAHIPVVESLSPVVHPLLLADSFFLNSSFFQLPNLLFYNTPQPFSLHS